ncbi:MAG: YraN family protein [Solirubrobacterales bacterium]|nr:YraN family protein [Solirubrobacterales bacterium]
MTDRRSQLGRLGEQLAAEHLVRRGFQIVERNYRTRWGELDIVAFDGQTLAFCEVKTRRASTVGGSPLGGSPFGGSPLGVSPLDAVRMPKRNQVRKMAGRWLIERTDRPHADTLRFDAIGITLDRRGRLVSLEHLEGAF